MPPTPWWMTLTRTSVCWIFASSRDRRLDGARDVALEHEVEVLDAALLQGGEEGLQRDAALDALRELLGAEALRAKLREMTGLALVLDDAADLSGGRRVVEAEDLDRVARTGVLELLAPIVVERAHLAPGVAGDHRVAHPQRAAVDEHRRDRAAADVEARLDDRARGLRLRVRGQLELGVGDEQDLLEQHVEVELLLRRHVRELRRAAPLLRLQALGRELALDLVDVRVRQVDLVDGDDDRHAGRARVGDGLLRLRHHAVVGRDDEHGDVGHLGAAGAHGGERLVARRVEEGDLAPVELDLIRADVLGDPARLGLGDGRLADRVEQRRLAVVDVAHDRHDRRPRPEILGSVLVGLRFGLLVGRVLDDHLALGLGGDQDDRLVGQRLRDRDHHAEAHHRLDDLGDGDAERGRELLHRDARRHRHRARRRRDRRSLRLALAAAGPLAIAGARRPGRRIVDHDPALAAGRALARADRAVRSVGAVRHQWSV